MHAVLRSPFGPCVSLFHFPLREHFYMKQNLKMVCILGLVASGMMGCGSDDHDKKENEQPSIEKLANGEVCVLGLECASGYCSPNGFCADVPVVIEKKPNGQSCVSANDCASGYCGTNWLCSDPPKSNGMGCTNADECVSHYCNAQGLCADAPKTNGMGCTNADECVSHYCNAQGLCADAPKANGEHCVKDDECISHYCNSEWTCVDVPKANGEQCAKDDECVSHYCNDSGKCADALKTNGGKCTSGTDCVSNYCDSDGKCADKPKPSSSVLDLQEVPDNQNNTDGASCDIKTFVEHCKDNRIVWCDVDADGKSVVKSDSCEGDYPTCSLTLLGGKNRALCIGNKSECTKGDKDDNYCETDKYGFAISQTYQCMQFEDGHYYYGYIGLKYCSGKCTKTKCVQETCDPTQGHRCSDDGKYTMECNPLEDGTYIYKSFNCSDDGSKCTVMEGWATCM